MKFKTTEYKGEFIFRSTTKDVAEKKKENSKKGNEEVVRKTAIGFKKILPASIPRDESRR